MKVMPHGDNSNSVTCPACSSRNVSHRPVLFPALFIGRFLAPRTEKAWSLRECERCGLVFGPRNSERTEFVEAVFTGKDYPMRNVRRHQVICNRNGTTASPQDIQAELLSPYLTMEMPRILDIGCFDGSLSVAFSKIFRNGVFHGFDINENLSEVYPQGSRFGFFTGALDLCEGPYDLIVLSHSIQYIPDVSQLMRDLKSLLAPDGLIFVQVPDFSVNPYSLLRADTFYHYTAGSLADIFAANGFSVNPVATGQFPRDVLGMARLGGNEGQQKRGSDGSLREALDYLYYCIQELSALKGKGAYCVLGTTIAAAAVNSVIKDKVDFFVDENPEKQGGEFQDKPVLSPLSLDDDSTLIIPYGDSARPILQRFEENYKGRFIVL